MSKNILDKIKNGEIEYQEADEGIVTSTYITDDYVVQEPDHGNGERLKRNRFICKTLHENGVPVPEVIEYSENPLYVIYEKLEGVSLDQEDKFSDEDYSEAVRNSGKALALIHDQKGFGYGKPDREQEFMQGSHDNWREFVQDYIQGSLDYVESERFRSVVKRASQIIDLEEIPEKPEKRILHMDYIPDNIMIDSELKAHVIDFDGAKYGDPRFELMYADMLMSKKGDEVAETFRQGYEEFRNTELTPELERNYLALAVMRDARGGEWCLRNDKDVDLDEWSQGLQNVVDNLE